MRNVQWITGFNEGERKGRIASDDWPYFEVDGEIKQSCRVGGSLSRRAIDPWAPRRTRTLTSSNPSSPSLSYKPLLVISSRDDPV